MYKTPRVSNKGMREQHRFNHCQHLEHAYTLLQHHEFQFQFTSRLVDVYQKVQIVIIVKNSYLDYGNIQVPALIQAIFHVFGDCFYKCEKIDTQDNEK